MIKVIVSVGLAMICLKSAVKAAHFSKCLPAQSCGYYMDFYSLLFLAALVFLTVMAAE